MPKHVIIFGLAGALLAFAPHGRGAERPPAPVAATWLDGAKKSRSAVIAVYLPKGAPARTCYAGFAFEEEKTEPGYGAIRPDSWRAFRVGPGEVVLARLRLEGRAPPYTLVRDHPAREKIDVHEMIDNGAPKGTILFDRAGAGGAVRVDRHLVAVGEKVGLAVDAPKQKGFFTDDTFEILRLARRLGIGSDDPGTAAGYVEVEWRAPREDSPARELAGKEGEKRIRSHFTKPDCPWANRHVGFMADYWILEYLRPATLEFTLDTSTVKSGGRVFDVRKGNSALAEESIWPNGFGGTSLGLDLPPILVVPEDTPIREVLLR
jgi:hypothetical protein